MRSHTPWVGFGRVQLTLGISHLSLPQHYRNQCTLRSFDRCRCSAFARTLASRPNNKNTVSFGPHPRCSHTHGAASQARPIEHPNAYRSHSATIFSPHATYTLYSSSTPNPSLAQHLEERDATDHVKFACHQERDVYNFLKYLYYKI